MSEHPDHVLRTHKGKLWATQISHPREGIPVTWKTASQTRPQAQKNPRDRDGTHHMPRKSIFTLQPKVCL
jgi:hypothetical protein